MKNLKNLGKTLNKEEQQSINGGWDQGGGPCGGDIIGKVRDFYCEIGAYGFQWWNGTCYACK